MTHSSPRIPKASLVGKRKEHVGVMVPANRGRARGRQRYEHIRNVASAFVIESIGQILNGFSVAPEPAQIFVKKLDCYKANPPAS